MDLSEHSPHDITGVLKHFLKEVGTKSWPTAFLGARLAPPWDASMWG